MSEKTPSRGLGRHRHRPKGLHEQFVNARRLEAAAERVRNSGTPLRIAIYSFTDRPLAQVLVAEADRGTVVELYRDGEQYEMEEQNGQRFHDGFRYLSVPWPPEYPRSHEAPITKRSYAREDLDGWDGTSGGQRELVPRRVEETRQ